MWECYGGHELISDDMPIAADLYYHAYQEGEKLPVVLIHGAGGTHLFWPSEIRRLLGFRVFALDLPGHGKSSGRGLQSIAAYATSVLDWMAALTCTGLYLWGIPWEEPLSKPWRLTLLNMY